MGALLSFGFFFGCSGAAQTARGDAGFPGDGSSGPLLREAAV